MRSHAVKAQDQAFERRIVIRSVSYKRITPKTPLLYQTRDPMQDVAEHDSTYWF